MASFSASSCTWGLHSRPKPAELTPLGVEQAQQGCSLHPLALHQLSPNPGPMTCCCCSWQIYRNKIRAEIEGRPFEIPPPSSIAAPAAAAAAPTRNRSYGSLPRKDDWDDWGSKDSAERPSQARPDPSTLNTKQSALRNDWASDHGRLGKKPWRLDSGSKSAAEHLVSHELWGITHV